MRRRAAISRHHHATGRQHLIPSDEADGLFWPTTLLTAAAVAAIALNIVAGHRERAADARLRATTHPSQQAEHHAPKAHP
jgi:hypothetical protein